MNQYGPPNPVGIFGPGTQPSAPSFVPQIASLGDLMDSITQRRIQLEKMDRSDEALAEKEAYGRRKQDIIEKKNDAKDEFERQRHNQEARKTDYAAIGSGRNPGTSVRWVNGQPVTVKWKYTGDAPTLADPPPQETAPDAQTALDTQTAPGPTAPGPAPTPTPSEPQAPPQEQPLPLGGPAVMNLPFALAQRHLPPPVATASPDGTTQVDPQLDALIERAPPPQEPAPTLQPPPALPPASPASATTPTHDGSATAQTGPQPQANALFVPGRDIRGSAMQMPRNPAGGRWVATSDDGTEVDSVDPGEARAARADENRRAIASTDALLADPSTEINPQLLHYLLSKKQALLADMSPAEINQVYGQQQRAELQGNQIASTEGMQDKSLASMAERSANQLASKEKLATAKLAAKKYPRTGSPGQVSLSGLKLAAQGDGDFISIPTTNRGLPQPNRLIAQVTSDWRSWAGDQDLKTQMKGLRRLSMAQNNIDANGPHSGVVNIEAVFNYLGFLRGGVPIQNETKEMISHRRTWGDWFHGFLANAPDLAVLNAKWEKGEELTMEETNRAINKMSPGEQARIREGIMESKKVMVTQVAASLNPFSKRYANMTGPGGHLLRQAAVSLVNTELEAAGLPHDYNPFTDTRSTGESQFLKREGEQAGGSPGEAKGGKLSDQQMLDALKGL